MIILLPAPSLTYNVSPQNLPHQLDIWQILFPNNIWYLHLEFLDVLSQQTYTKLRSKLLHGVFLLAKPFFLATKET